jgi:uncharacterized protein
VDIRMNNGETYTVLHNEAEKRFEVRLDGRLSELTYHMANERIIFTYTGVPPALEGRGIGGALVKAGLDYAQTHNLGVVPLCSFVGWYIAQHPEYQPLIQN